MIRRFLAALLTVCLMIPAIASEPGDPQADSSPRPLTADREQLRQVMVKERIESGRSRPGVSTYFNDLATALSLWLADWMSELMPRFARLAEPMTEPLLKFLLGLSSLVIAGALLRLAWHRWGRAASPQDPAIRRLPVAETPATTPHWESELERRLAERDAKAASLALWWWLAQHLVGDRAEPSWTSRELIARAGRRDLMPGVRRLDRMLYGATAPRAREVKRLWTDLREALG